VEKLSIGTLHCLLAAYIALDKASDFAIWPTAFPTLKSFETDMPFLWPPELQALLPKPAKEILKKQRHNYRRDWEQVAEAFPHLEEEAYLHSWLLVNTRSFFYGAPGLERFAQDDRIALLPVADLFNHADVGCSSTFTEEHYTITADRNYRVGEEVFFCYGGHSNDFLLAEYGFLLEENRWDTVCLDEVILSSMEADQMLNLEDSGFSGAYMLGPETVGCFRTQVALRMLCGTHEQWKRYVDAEVEDEVFQGIVDELLVSLLETYVEMITRTIEDIGELEVGMAAQRKLLVARWIQIQDMIMQTIGRLDG
jgi:hypothetical protein